MWVINNRTSSQLILKNHACQHMQLMQLVDDMGDGKYGIFIMNLMKPQLVD